MNVMADMNSNRIDKGKSLLGKYFDFTAIDLETTGYDPRCDEIIELGAVKYRNGEPVDAFDMLVNPGKPLDPFIVGLTGITDEMLINAPEIGPALDAFLHFVGTDTVVGHNVNFDVNFIYDYCLLEGLPHFSNSYVDTMRISRRMYKNWENHKLDTLIKNLGVSVRGLHRADNDARIAAECYLQMINDPSFEAAMKDALPKHRRPQKYLYASQVLPEPGHEDENSILYGAVCVFTGALEQMVRRDAMQLVVNIGGKCADSVTKKTNYLILGNNDYRRGLVDGKSSKQRKAEELIKAGADLKIISESVFYDIVFDD